MISHEFEWIYYFQINVFIKLYCMDKTSEKLAAPGDGWRGWLRTGVPGGVMLAAYAPEAFYFYFMRLKGN